MKNYTLLFAALFVFFLTSCEKEIISEIEPVNSTETQNDLSTQTFDTPTDVSGKGNIIETIQNNPDFSLFNEALHYTGLNKYLHLNGITVFAPNNDAMEILLENNGFTYIKGFPKEDLEQIIKAHISITGIHYIHSSVRGFEVEVLLEKEMLYINTSLKLVHFGSLKSPIYLPNQKHNNGMVHFIKSVIMP